MVNAGAAGPYQTPKAVLMNDDLSNPYRAAVAGLNAELGWGLSPVAQEQYADAMSKLVKADCPDQRMRTILQNYHEDHRLLAILHQQDHPEHNHAWEQIKRYITNFMQKKNLAWSSDQATDYEDLVQIACMEVAKKMDTFRFESRFTTWYTTVAVRSIQRTFRDSLAKKRAIRPDSLEYVDESLLSEDSLFDSQISGTLLREKVSEILGRHPNPLMLKIFLLKFYHDQGTKEIGELIHYHPSRVRALLAEAKTLLQRDPSLRDWLEDRRGRDEPGAV